MLDLTSHYAGLVLRNPIVVASSGMTNSLEKIGRMVDAGAAAVVLKSLFEEQIDTLSTSMMKEHDYPEAADYVAEYVKANEIGKYLEFITEAKKRFNTPIIASINCYKAGDWVDYARQIENAGADAIEVNIMRLEDRVNTDITELYREYIDIVRSVADAVKIPVGVKINKAFASLGTLVDRMRIAGAKGITLFNRSYQMDIDIENERVSGGAIFTHPHDIADTLRYTGILSAKIPNLDISASSGIHDGAGVVKALLAGASSTQMCSAIYLNGPKAITEALEGLKKWMTEKKYQSIADFRGKLSADNGADATLYSRMQFMKYFSSRGE